MTRSGTASVPLRSMEASAHPAVTGRRPPSVAADQDSFVWLRDLRSEGAEREAAVARLHALLLRAARFEVARRGPSLRHLRGNELDEIGLEAADDALMSVLARLDDFRGASRFTTWGLQVRAARGGREAAQTCLAGTRGAART